MESKKNSNVDFKLEVVVIPVSDVDRAKSFYGGLGWRLDADHASDDGYFRVIQFTPPGSGCSVIFGKDVTGAAPGSAQGLYLIVSDIKAARDELISRGVEISEVFHDADGVYAGTDEPYLFGRRRVGGLDPEHRSYRSFASFRDPDGNGWLLQEVSVRLPGRLDAVDDPNMEPGNHGWSPLSLAAWGAQAFFAWTAWRRMREVTQWSANPNKKRQPAKTKQPQAPDPIGLLPFVETRPRGQGGRNFWSPSGPANAGWLAYQNRITADPAGPSRRLASRNRFK